MIFVGPVSRNKPPKGGDHFKNRLILEILHSLDFRVSIIDTSNNLGRIKLVLFLVLERFWVVDKLLISASSASTYRFLENLSERTRKRTSYFVMGGALAQIIRSNSFKPAIYNSLKNLIVQGETIKNDLYGLGITSEVLNNFKHRAHLVGLNLRNSKELRLVFVSRITVSKGVLTILEALCSLSKNKVSCTFFGPCDKDMKQEISNNPYANHAGYLDFYTDPKESYSTLAEFDAMVFPTKWHGEGFPGVFLDAFMVGLPVICSDWNMNSEVIQDGYNGIVLKENNAEYLADAINKIDTDRVWLNELSKNSMASFDQYNFETAKVRIKEILS
jgi:glycosyltransferase involved in cell wall biosynthesis